MSTSALTTNADKLDECIDKNEKREKQSQHFLSSSNKEIKQPKKLDQIRKVISKITKKSSSPDDAAKSHRGSEESDLESAYGSDDYDTTEIGVAGENPKVNTSNKIEEKLLKAVKNRSQRKFEKYLERCTEISSVKDEEGNNVLHRIASLEKKQKRRSLNVLTEKISKEDLAQLINSEDRNGKTPLQVALVNKITKGKHESNTTRSNDNTLKFLVKLLGHGTNPDQLSLPAKDLEKLSEEQNKYYCKFLEKLAKRKPEIETKVKEIIAYTINTSDSNSNYLLHSAIKNKDEELFKELLQKGADISLKDANGNNALHYIALLEGRQKVTCLKLMLGLVKERKISEDQLRDAVNAPNGEGNTPLELALIKKVEKGKHLSQVKTISNLKPGHDNTTKFCAMLLQNGANPNYLDLKDEKFHTDKYYLVLRDLKDYSKTPHTAQEKARETKEQLEKRYNIKTLPKQLQSTAQNVGSSIKKGASATGKIFSAVAKYIDPAKRTRELLAITITTTVIAMVTFAFFQGQVAIGAAIPIIAIAGVICLTLTLGFSGIKKLFENSTNEAKNPINNDQQNLAKSSEEQKTQKSSGQSLDNPDTKMDDPSITNLTGHLKCSAG